VKSGDAKEIRPALYKGDLSVTQVAIYVI